jgi:hypothetical protein
VFGIGEVNWRHGFKCCRLSRQAAAPRRAAPDRDSSAMCPVRVDTNMTPRHRLLPWTRSSPHRRRDIIQGGRWGRIWVF